jgi:hypothetical protein
LNSENSRDRPQNVREDSWAVRHPDTASDAQQRLRRTVRPLDQKGTLSENFVQAVEDSPELFVCGPRHPSTDSIDGECTNLANLDPRSLIQTRGLAFEREGESRARLLTSHRNGDHCSGSIVEHVMTQD